MAINLLRLEYPQRFEQFCKDLLAAEFPRFQTFSGQDEGIDGYDPDSGTIFQFYFPEGTPKRRKVKQDLAKATRHPLKAWVLLLPKDPPKKFDQWLRKEQQALYPFEIDLWGRTRILGLLRKHPDVKDTYFGINKQELSTLAWKIRDAMVAAISGKGGSPAHYQFSEDWFRRRFVRERWQTIREALLWLQENRLVPHTPPDIWQLSGTAQQSAGPWGNPWGSPTIHVAQQTASQITNVAASGPTTIKVAKGPGRTVVVPPPPGAISEAQLREIDDQAARIEKESGGKATVGFIKKRIKQIWSLTTVRYLSQNDYPDVLDYLRGFKWEQRRQWSPEATRKHLIRTAHAKARNIGWSHDKLSQACREWYGRRFGNLSVHLLRNLVSRLEEMEAQHSG